MPPGIRRSKNPRPSLPRWVHVRSRWDANMLLWLLEDLSEKLDCLLDSFPRLCRKVFHLKREFSFLVPQVLGSVVVWDGLQQIGHSPWVLQTWIDLWMPIMDLDLDQLLSPLISLQGCLRSPNGERGPVWTIWVLTQAYYWLNQTNVGLLLSRFREVEQILRHVPCELEEWQVIPCNSLSSHPPRNVKVRHVLAHLSRVIDVLLALTEPYMIHSLFDLEEIWTVLQNRQCWAFIANELS